MAVYKQYDQQQLNDQYNNRLQVPGFAEYFERWEKASRYTEKAQVVFRDIFYGTHPLECLDVFPAAIPNAKTLVFIHGGYWHLLDKKMFHFLAPAFLEKNVTIVLLNYPLAPLVSMDTIVSSCRRAMVWLQNNLTNYNGNPKQVYVAGHSAGGHLACMLACDNNTNFLKGIISLSGLYDLEPLRLSDINTILQMDSAMSVRNSPIDVGLVHPCPLLLAVGGDETDEFKEQAHKMYEYCNDKRHDVQLMYIPGKNHFSILDAVTEPGSLLQSAIFRLMEIEG
ncbi:MAG: alpha/beta hydrolase [Ginsengibacter sp.]